MSIKYNNSLDNDVYNNFKYKHNIFQFQKNYQNHYFSIKCLILPKFKHQMSIETKMCISIDFQAQVRNIKQVLMRILVSIVFSTFVLTNIQLKNNLQIFMIFKSKLSCFNQSIFASLKGDYKRTFFLLKHIIAQPIHFHHFTQNLMRYNN